MFDGTTLILAAGAILVATAAMTAVLLLWPDRRPAAPAAPASAGLPPPRTFRFRDGFLVSSAGGSEFLLPKPVNQLTAWDDLRAALAALVPGSDAALERLVASGEGFRLKAPVGGDLMQVIGLRDGEETAITVLVAPADGTDVRVDVGTIEALTAETTLLHASQDASPSLSWVVDREGRVIWGNARYLAEVAQARGTEAAGAWPLPALFPIGEDAPAGPTRRSLGGPGRPERWFEVVQATPRGGLRHCHAQPLNRLIEAESNLRTFIQTLTRTFAALPTGLAIFDHDRKLVMYNPPFLDMTGLDGAWLTTKPALFSVLDALRESQRIPEPRDWKRWRGEVAGGGEGGEAPWQETWTLAGGQSMRMTARPQGGSAVAILLEDVTAEVALARRRRSDGAFLAAMLDAGTDAFAAFASDGGGVHLNATMRRLLDVAPGEGGAGDERLSPSLDAVTARLAALFRADPVWGEVRDRIARGDVGRGWSGTVDLGTDGHVEVKAVPMTGERIALRVSGALGAARRTRAAASGPDAAVGF